MLQCVWLPPNTFLHSLILINCPESLQRLVTTSREPPNELHCHAKFVHSHDHHGVYLYDQATHPASRNIHYSWLACLCCYCCSCCCYCLLSPRSMSSPLARSGAGAAKPEPERTPCAHVCAWAVQNVAAPLSYAPEGKNTTSPWKKRKKAWTLCKLQQSYPLHKTRFGQYQASTIIQLCWGDQEMHGDCYHIHKMHSHAGLRWLALSKRSVDLFEGILVLNLRLVGF